MTSSVRLWIFRALAPFLPLLLASNQLFAAGQQANPANNKIIKWVDEKGVTHYGDSMPAQYSGRDSTVINSQGIVILKRDKTAKSQAGNSDKEVLDKANMEQQRHDRALLAAYTTEQEIDLARDRNLQLDEVIVQGLQQRKASAQTRLETSKKVADGFNNRKKPVPADITRELQEIQAEIAKIEDQIVQRHTNMDATRKRFDNDKRRFVELKTVR